MPIEFDPRKWETSEAGDRWAHTAYQISKYIEEAVTELSEQDPALQGHALGPAIIGTTGAVLGTLCALHGGSENSLRELFESLVIGAYRSTRSRLGGLTATEAAIKLLEEFERRN